MSTAPDYLGDARRGGVTLEQLRAMSDVAAAWLAELAAAAMVDPDDWQDPEVGRRYKAALEHARTWVATGAVHAYVGETWAHVASSALDAAYNAVLSAPHPAAYMVTRCGGEHLYFGEDAARELGAWHRQHSESPFGDLDDEGSARLMDHLGETSPTTEANHDYRRRLCDAYTAGLAGPSQPATLADRSA